MKWGETEDAELKFNVFPPTSYSNVPWTACYFEFQAYFWVLFCCTWDQEEALRLFTQPYTNAISALIQGGGNYDCSYDLCTSKDNQK